MRPCGDHYEYIVVYIDDLGITSKDPKAIVDKLEGKYGFKLKGTGPIKFHLSCDYFCDSQGMLCFAPRKYIEKMIDTYVRLFGMKPTKQYTVPLEKGNHPEIDNSEELGLEETKIYQYLIGVMQWAIQLGRMDITTTVMTTSRFQATPHHGHLERCKCIYRYLSKF